MNGEPAVVKTGYYSSTGRKIGDFFIGFVGLLVVFILLGVYLVNGSGNNVPVVLGLAAGAAIAGPIICFSTGRRFIAIGMLCSLLVPLLAVGACFVMLLHMEH